MDILSINLSIVLVSHEAHYFLEIQSNEIEVFHNLFCNELAIRPLFFRLKIPKVTYCYIMPHFLANMALHVIIFFILV